MTSALVARDLGDAKVTRLSADRRFTTAYYAALSVTHMAIACAGYRVTATSGRQRSGNRQRWRGAFQRAVARESVILLSSIVASELWYGVAKSQRKDRNTQRLEAFSAGPLEWTLFEEEDARALPESFALNSR